MHAGRGAAIAAAAAAALGLAACGSANGPKGAKKVAVTLDDSGCTPGNISVNAGPVTFDVTNGGTSKVSEMELKNSSGIILGESENVVEGVPGHFSLNLQPGKYIVNCPNGSEEDKGKLSATGTGTGLPKGASAALLNKADAQYATYVQGEVKQLQSGTKQFVAAVDAGNLKQAETLFGPVRRHYEAIEPVAESFSNLDAAIDARVNDVTNPSQWTGFHRIEQILWVRKTTAGTKPYTTKLMDDVNRLETNVQTLKLQPATLANGAVELMNEVANSKITGEEDRYSHTDLSDFEGNLTGSREAFDLLVPALKETGNAKLAAEIDQRFAAVQTTLDTYKRPTPLGFALYSALTQTDRKKFATEVDSLDEPLSTIAAKVSGA